MRCTREVGSKFWRCAATNVNHPYYNIYRYTLPQLTNLSYEWFKESDQSGVPLAGVDKSSFAERLNNEDFVVHTKRGPTETEDVAVYDLYEYEGLFNLESVEDFDIVASHTVEQNESEVNEFSMKYQIDSSDKETISAAIHMRAHALIHQMDMSGLQLIFTTLKMNIKPGSLEEELVMAIVRQYSKLLETSRPPLPQSLEFFVEISHTQVTGTAPELEVIIKAITDDIVKNNSLKDALSFSEALIRLKYWDEAIWEALLQPYSNMLYNVTAPQCAKLIDILVAVQSQSKIEFGELFETLLTRIMDMKIEGISPDEIASILYGCFVYSRAPDPLVSDLCSAIIRGNAQFSSVSSYLKASYVLIVQHRFTDLQLCTHFIFQCVRFMLELQETPKHLLFLLQGLSQNPFLLDFAVLRMIESPDTDGSYYCKETKSIYTEKNVHNYTDLRSFDFSKWKPISVYEALKGIYKRVASLLDKLSDSEFVQAVQVFASTFHHPEETKNKILDEALKRTAQFENSTVATLLSSCLSLQGMQRFKGSVTPSPKMLMLLEAFNDRFINERADGSIGGSLSTHSSKTTGLSDTLYPDVLDYTINGDCLAEILLVYGHFQFISKSLIERFVHYLQRNNFQMLEGNTKQARSYIYVLHYLSDAGYEQPPLYLKLYECLSPFLSTLTTNELLTFLDSIRLQKNKLQTLGSDAVKELHPIMIDTAVQNIRLHGAALSSEDMRVLQDLYTELNVSPSKYPDAEAVTL